MRLDAYKPPNPPPSGYPITIMEMQRARHLVLENSATTALVQDSIPPIPRPVNTRQMASCPGLEAVVARIIPVTITTRHPNKVGRRTILSASPPRKTEPNAIQISSLDNTIPSA